MLTSRKNNFNLLIATGKDNKASGDLFWDDGETIDTITTEKYNHISYAYGNSTNSVRVCSLKAFNDFNDFLNL